ncbi:hypothetical protein ACQP1W_44725 [Spirillospora sp. CA-255316]
MTMPLPDQAAMTARQDGRVTDERPGRPDRPKRRTFTAAYKARILAAYDALPAGSPERGALLRTERLYHSHIEHWRKQAANGTLPASSGKPKKDPDTEHDQSVRDPGEVPRESAPAAQPRPARLGPRKPFHHPAELSAAERDQVLAVLDSERFADKSVDQAWATLLDQGTYLCSQSTMYQLLRERGQTGERRAQATRPATRKPELEADGPNQLWSSDITKLKGPVCGIYYLLYVIIDIFSRKVIW